MGRRSETTEFLKENIADALIHLMESTDIDKIKVKEITDLANVGRVTYFRNFHSKNDVLIFKLILLWKRWDQQHPLNYTEDYYETTKNFFHFCLSIKPLLNCFYRNHLDIVLLDAFTEYVILPSAQDDSSIQYRNIFVVYGMFGLVNEWAKRDFAETPEELAKLICKNTTMNS